MRYLKKVKEDTTEHFGRFMGASWYAANGWIAYDGALPLSRLDIVDGEIVELTEPEAEVVPRVFSKLRIFEHLDSLGLWDALGPQIESVGGEYWRLANDIREDHPKFSDVLAALTSAAESNGIDIGKFLDRCVMEA